MHDCARFRRRAVAPFLELLSPAVESLVVVAAGIEFDLTVQPDVDEVRSQILHVWPSLGRIRNHEGQSLAPAAAARTLR